MLLHLAPSLPAQYRPMEGVAMPAWLQSWEALHLDPARAALLLHCHMVRGAARAGWRLSSRFP